MKPNRFLFFLKYQFFGKAKESFIEDIREVVRPKMVVNYMVVFFMASLIFFSTTMQLISGGMLIVAYFNSLYVQDEWRHEYKVRYEEEASRFSTTPHKK